jgi:transposase
MNMHQNARLTVSCRVLLAERVLGGRRKVQVAQELGVSIKTADKWLKRYRDEGMEGLRDRSSRPSPRNPRPANVRQCVRQGVCS